MSGLIKTETYLEQLRRLPQKGKRIIARRDGAHIIVYQAYNPPIAQYAVTHQHLGGPHYNFNRLSWIKPGFLWMMFRSGWATKEHQEHILAITLPLIRFKTMLGQAVFSAYTPVMYATPEEWKQQQEATDVRLQWDPDHDPYGHEEDRRAIQVGLKGDILKRFCTEWIVKIEDITPFVKAEYEKVEKHDIEFLRVPYEEVIEISEPEIIKRIGMTV